MNKQINAMYFSATDTTKKVVTSIANQVSLNAGRDSQINMIDFTLPASRREAAALTEEDIVIVGVPVYAGRVPNILLKYLRGVAGNGALAVAVVLYGNRNYDDALIELTDILALNGFKVVAGGAFIGEHSFSKVLAQNRPDEKDMAIVKDFADQIYRKITTNNKWEDLFVNGHRPYRSYYTPKNKNNEPVDLRKVTPRTRSNCINCKLCVDLCPMGSIDYEDTSKINGICIKCCACIKKCPTDSKYFVDENYLRHKQELEVDFSCRREPEIFL
ncbi:MAG TPA: EFR1 family ferrodoxin [Selenomonadales bacterium]|nr:EFR1 family ferrodoxin [Selenomonadales bacterium]